MSDTSPELTVEAALKELREMYPTCFLKITMTELETPDGLRHVVEESGWFVSAYPEEHRPLNWYVGEYADTLSEAMDQVRQWCESQKDVTR